MAEPKKPGKGAAQVAFLHQHIDTLLEQTAAHEPGLVSTITAGRYTRALQAMRNVITIEVYDKDLNEIWDSPVLTEIADALGFERPRPASDAGDCDG